MNPTQNTLDRDHTRAPTQPGLKALAIGLRIFCALPFATGAYDLISGVKVLTGGGARIPPSVELDPVLNSQIKFWGAIWFGFGLVLWYASRDLRRHATLFRLLMGTILLSGLGRALSAAQFGAGSALITGFMVFELTAPIAAVVWHGWLLRRAGGPLN